MFVITMGAGLAPRAASATPRRIVYLGTLRRDQAPGLLEALEQELRARGYDERRAAIELRVVDGHVERLPALASEIVATRPDVIVAGTNAEITAARHATRTIPIVMVIASDPVRTGLVESLARPGGNVTGLTLDVTPDVWGKRLEILIEFAGRRDRVALVAGAQSANRQAAAEALRAAGAARGIKMVEMVVSSADELRQRLPAMTQQAIGAVVLLPDPALYRDRSHVAEIAVQSRMPVVYPLRQFAEAGGLVSYGADVLDLYRRAAGYVERLLGGANPRDLPVEQPSKFELVVNTKAAKSLGVSPPPSLLLRADQVIG